VDVGDVLLIDIKKSSSGWLH